MWKARFLSKGISKTTRGEYHLSELQPAKKKTDCGQFCQTKGAAYGRIDYPSTVESFWPETDLSLAAVMRCCELTSFDKW